MTFKNIIKKIFHKLGIKIQKINPATSSQAQLMASLRKFNIDLVFDVGANFGQFAIEIREGGFKGKIISFEPLTSAYDKLKKVNMLSGDAEWEIFPRCALGNLEGEITINIAGNSASSSILNMLDSHINIAPHTKNIGKETTPIYRLDSVAKEYLLESTRPFLKIDTQGFEWQVLDGALNSIPQIQGVLLELSLIPLYQDQKLWGDLIKRMSDYGFTLWSIQPMFTDMHDGRTYQIDGIFYRDL